MWLPLLFATLASATPAWNGHEPAHSEYRATEDDFRVFERGLADAAKVAPKIFPRGRGDVDAVLYDTKYLYIYSKSSGYALPKFRRRGGWQVYRVAEEKSPEEHEMAICNAGAGPAPVEMLRTITERSLACAPWGTFGRIQKERRSDYRFIEGYWDSMIHEYGHQYRARYVHDPTPEMTAIDAAIAKAKLSPDVDPASAADEGYAIWCELAGARVLYPEQYKRLMNRAKRPGGTDDVYGHDAGLRAAAALILKKASR
jgi:hypothetical protein